MRGAFFRECLRLFQLMPVYQWGGRLYAPGDGLDCSGFVTVALYRASEKRIDWRATHNTDKLWALPKVQQSQLRPGDLVLYWGDSKGPDDVSHVMVYIGEGQVVGMPYGGPSDTRPATVASGKYAHVLNLNYRPDVAGCVQLPID